MKKVYFILFCWIGSFLSADASHITPLNLDQLTVEDGLSQSEVTCLLKDRKGYVWIGTKSGLNRYDGHGFKHYLHNPFDSTTISSDQIFSLHEDSRGRLWVGTARGLNRLDPTNNRFVSQVLPEKGKNLLVTALTEDHQQTLWVGTHRGLTHLSLEGKVLEKTLLTDQLIRCVFQDKRKEIWIGTTHGLQRIVQQQTAKPKLVSVDYQGNRLLPAFPEIKAAVQAITEDQAGNLWIATHNGLYKIDPYRKTVKAFGQSVGLTDHVITCLLVDHQQVLWVGTQQGGICRFKLGNQGNPTFMEAIQEDWKSRKGLRNNFITVLYEGHDPHEDIVWVGLVDSGVHLYSRSKNNFRHWDGILATGQSSRANLVFALHTDALGSLWIGTYQGLYQVNRQTRDFKVFRHEKNNQNTLNADEIQCIFSDKTGTLWVGTTSGLNRFDREKKHFMRVSIATNQPLTVLKIYQDQQGLLWLGTYGGLWQLNPQTLQTQLFDNQEYKRNLAAVKINYSHYPAAAIQEDANGNLWVGTAKGINKIDCKTKQVIHFENDPANPQSLISERIMHILLDHQKQLWICGDKGLSKVVTSNGHEKFVNYAKQTGLPNGMIYSALADQNNRFWLSTNLGLSCFDPRQNTFKNYDVHDGLASNEFNMGAFCQSADGELFFGGIGSVVSFDPLSMVANQHRPKVAITSFEKAGKTLSFDSLMAQKNSIELNYNENIFSFQFAALDFTNSQKNQYAYRLEGLDNQWVFCENRRFVNFTNLPSGNYVLHLKAANGDGVWNDSQLLSIPINIHPPFWQTWWFYLISTLLILAIAKGFYNYRVRLKVKRLLEIERVKLEENERVRQLAARDLHDEFGNTITRISVLTELIKNRLNGSNQEVSALLTKISDNSQRMYQGTKDFIWSINPEHDNFYEIAIRLKDFSDDLFDKTDSTLHVSGIAEDLRLAALPMGVSRHLVLLFKEAMSNTLKHAQASQVYLTFAFSPDELKIVWQDNGMGFTPKQSFNGNGLQNMYSRAEKIGGELEVYSGECAGTTISFYLPLSKNQPKNNIVETPVLSASIK